MLLDCVATLLGDIQDKEDGGLQVSHGRDRLHFDGVAFFQGMVQDSWCINHLPSDESAHIKEMQYWKSQPAKGIDEVFRWKENKG